MRRASRKKLLVRAAVKHDKSMQLRQKINALACCYCFVFVVACNAHMIGWRYMNKNHVKKLCERFCMWKFKKNHKCNQSQARKRNLRCFSPHHSHGLTFFIFFFINVKSTITPSFSFMEADLAMRQLLIGVRDGTLKIGCSHVI